MQIGIGDAVIVRTARAGVHFGYFAARTGREVTLERSRRIWRWRGANTLSEVSLHGIRTDYSRVSEAVTILLLDAIEIIPCAEDAAKKIEACRWAK